MFLNIVAVLIFEPGLGLHFPQNLHGLIDLGLFVLDQIVVL